MPNQLIALVTQLTAKTASFVSIRHSPGFGIAPQVMRCDPRNASRCRIPLEQLPDNLFAQTDGLHLAGAVHGPEYKSVSDTSRGSPRTDRHLDPRWHGYRPHAAMLANEVHDAPPSVALLDVGDGERRHLGSPQAAAQEHRQDRTVAEAMRYAGIRSVQQRLGLPDRKPVPQADTFGGPTPPSLH